MSLIAEQLINSSVTMMMKKIKTILSNNNVDVNLINTFAIEDVLCDHLTMFVHDMPKKFKDEPKKPKSSYSYFCENVKEKVKKNLIEKLEIEKVSVALMSKEFASAWKRLQTKPEKVEKYKKLALDDVERYKTEVVEYATMNPLWKNPLEKRGRQTKEKKPKGPRTAYSIFYSENKKMEKEELSARWKELNKALEGTVDYELLTRYVEESNKDREERGLNTVIPKSRRPVVSKKSKTVVQNKQKRVRNTKSPKECFIEDNVESVMRNQPALMEIEARDFLKKQWVETVSKSKKGDEFFDLKKKYMKMAATARYEHKISMISQMENVEEEISNDIVIENENENNENTNTVTEIIPETTNNNTNNTNSQAEVDSDESSDSESSDSDSSDSDSDDDNDESAIALRKCKSKYQLPIPTLVLKGARTMRDARKSKKVTSLAQ
jgi:hypothetical protein